MNWIKVEEETPKTDYAYHSIPVIIFCDWVNGKKVIGAFYSNEDYFHTHEGLQYDGVTHWMRMPSVPNR